MKVHVIPQVSRYMYLKLIVCLWHFATHMHTPINAEIRQICMKTRILHMKILKLCCISVATCVLGIHVTIHVWMHPDPPHVSLHVRSCLTHTLQPQSCSVRKVQHFTCTHHYVFPSTSSFTTMYIHIPMTLCHCHSVVDLRPFTLPVAYLPIIPT